MNIHTLVSKGTSSKYGYRYLKKVIQDCSCDGGLGFHIEYSGQPCPPMFQSVWVGLAGKETGSLDNGSIEPDDACHPF